MPGTQLPVLPRANVHFTRYYKGGPRRNHVIVLHTSEGGEGPDSEQALTNFIESPRTEFNVASYNSWNDVNSIRPGVRGSDTAYHCGGFNSSYGHCFTGKAGQTVEQWSDSMSAPSIELGARYCAQLFYAMGAYEDWFRWLTNEQLSANMTQIIPGFSTHNQVRLVFGRTTHTDPGPNFPFDRFMDLALDEFRKLSKTVGTFPPYYPQEDEVRYRYFVTPGFHDVLAVGPGVPFNPGQPGVQVLVDNNLVNNPDGSPKTPGTSYIEALITIPLDLWTRMNGGKQPVAPS